MLELQNVYSSIGGFKIIRDVSLEIKKGDFVALLGSNGAGKTTLLKTITGVIKSTKGTIKFKGLNIERLPCHTIVTLGMSLCPEGRQLFPQLSVMKNLMLGAYTRQKNTKEVKHSLEQVFDLFPILKERRHQLAGTFSGGQQQMLAIARALMSKPDLLLLDEPSIGLAPLIVEKIAETLQRISKEMGTTIFLSEQNAHIALMITDRGYVLENGKMVLTGPSKQLISDNMVKKAYLGA